jgi:hypothetical protein
MAQTKVEKLAARNAELVLENAKLRTDRDLWRTRANNIREKAYNLRTEHYEMSRTMARNYETWSVSLKRMEAAELALNAEVCAEWVD